MGIGLVIVGLVVVIVIRLLAGSMDGDRVKRYVSERGGRVVESNWAPFGKGWFGEKNDRIYDVRYVDRDGNQHVASCKTSLFSGVYFTEDRIVRYADRPADDLSARLAEENRQLREEVDRLRENQG